ncbi:MAG TPA: hypothetical protein DDW89_09040 [Gammaproteobacteria bacterium]|nr:hypothetical protein [Gammaproteobacteria bacterium]
MTAPEIAATLGMGERSIYNRLGPIHKDGELHKDGVRTLDGRPYTVWRLAPCAVALVRAEILAEDERSEVPSSTFTPLGWMPLDPSPIDQARCVLGQDARRYSRDKPALLVAAANERLRQMGQGLIAYPGVWAPEKIRRAS